jgi:cytochrome P450
MTDTHLPPRSAPAELYDPLFHTPQDDVYELYATLREHHPVYYNKSRNVWCLTRHKDVQTAARDWKTFSNIPGVDLDTP